MARPRRPALLPVRPSRLGLTRTPVGDPWRYIGRNGRGLGDLVATAALRSRSRHLPQWHPLGRSDSKEMATPACSARTPRPRSTECGRGTCRVLGCPRRGRIGSRTQARPLSRAVHRPRIRLRPQDHPKSDQVRDSVACRSGSLLSLARVDLARLAWLARESGSAREDGATCQGA